MQKGIRKNGICIEYVKDNEVLSNCFYDLDLNIIEVIKHLIDLITNYNESNLVDCDKEDDVIAVMFFENKKRSNNKYLDIKASLMEDSLEDILELYDERFLENCDGRIAYNESDKELNETEAGILIRIFIDERKIYIEDLEFKKIFMEKFIEENPDIELDEFEYDLSEFNFYDLSDILKFMEKHFINSNESYFKIIGDSKFVYTIM